MEIKDLTGLSEPLKKLVETISNGIGVLYEPRRIRKKADADAYRLETEAIAEAKRIQIEGEAKINILERAKQRLVFQELQRQENIEEIAEKAIEFLDEGNTSNEPVDENWITKFFNHAQDIKSDKARVIWAKILAREVESPGSISLRCIDNLRNISAKEAKIFTKLCKLITNKSEIYYPNDVANHQKILGISFEQIGLLKDAGLIKPSHLRFFSFGFGDDAKEFNFGGNRYTVSTRKKIGLGMIKYHELTNVGIEICSLMTTVQDSRYIEEMINYINEENVIMKMGDE